LGALQGRPPLVELVVNVSVAWPDPIVTVAAPEVGVFAEMTLVVPGPPAVGLSVIPVTALPAGTFSVTVTLTPCG
jgi:hypothetical protein